MAKIVIKMIVQAVSLKNETPMLSFYFYLFSELLFDSHLFSANSSFCLYFMLSCLLILIGDINLNLTQIHL